jgi:hypothetical protein
MTTRRLVSRTALALLALAPAMFVTGMATAEKASAATAVDYNGQSFYATVGRNGTRIKYDAPTCQANYYRDISGGAVACSLGWASILENRSESSTVYIDTAIHRWTGREWVLEPNTSYRGMSNCAVAYGWTCKYPTTWSLPNSIAPFDTAFVGANVFTGKYYYNFRYTIWVKQDGRYIAGNLDFRLNLDGSFTNLLP